jgi:hypothetical protein
MRKWKRKGFKELFKHTKMRMLERYNIDLTEEQYRQMTAAIKHNRDYAHFKMRQTITRSVWIVDMLGIRIVAVYNRKASLVCTVLPADMADPEKIQYRNYD